MATGEPLEPRAVGESLVWEITERAGSDAPDVQMYVLASLLTVFVGTVVCAWGTIPMTVLGAMAPIVLLFAVYLGSLYAQTMASGVRRTRVTLTASRIAVDGDAARGVDWSLGRITGVEVRLHPIMSLVLLTRSGELVIPGGDHQPGELQEAADRIQDVVDTHRGWLEEQRAVHAEHADALRAVAGAALESDAS